MGEAMSELLEFIFSSGWVYFGTLFLIYSIGYAVSIPFMWYYKLKQHKLTKTMWQHKGN